jgi:transcriptional regulator with XRE-family HTH domain
MSEKDFAHAAIDAINRGDLKSLFEKTIEMLSAAGPFAALAQEALAAGIAFGRADATNQPAPSQAVDFLKFMADAPIAPEAFRTLRKELKISQTDVAELCGVTHATISAWENGSEPMPIVAINALMMLATGKLPKPEDVEDVISGADLRALRKKLGMTQRGLAEALGVSQPAIAKWELAAPQPLAAAAVRRIRPQLETLLARAAAA